MKHWIKYFYPKYFRDHFKISPTHIEWGGNSDGKGWFWFYWWHSLKKDVRYIGYEQWWYDGPISHFGFWFFNWSWCLPWTCHDGQKGWSYNPYTIKLRKRIKDEQKRIQEKSDRSVSTTPPRV